MSKILLSVPQNFIKGNRVYFVISIYIVIILLGLKNSGLSHNDYTGMMSNLLEYGAGEELDFSFYFSYSFFSMFSKIGISPDVLATVLGFFIIYYSFYFQNKFKDFLILFYIFIPSFFMNLGKPSKEFFVTTFFLIAFHLGVRGRYRAAGTFIIAYALMFRVYYIPLGLIMFYFTIKSAKIRLNILILSLIATFIIIGFYSDNVIGYVSDIQARRDIGYFNNEDIRRTGFGNLYYTSGLENSILNYWYAFFKINFPLFFDFDIKDIFLQIYIIFIFIITVICRRVYFIFIPLFVNFMIYPIFEPDLGSYLRHIASIFPLYFLLYTLWRNKKYSPIYGGLNVRHF